MPRKVDGMPFELFTLPTQGEDGNPLLYARPMGAVKRSLKDVDSFYPRTRMSSGELSLAFEIVIDAFSEFLAQGSRVETPLGVFSAKLKLASDFTDPSKVKGKDVEFAGIELTPSKAFLQSVQKN